MKIGAETDFGRNIPVLATAITGVELRELVEKDAQEYYDLIQQNRTHLTQYGDFLDLVSCTYAEIQAQLVASPCANMRMAIWKEHKLIGLVNLNMVAKRVFVLGYWLGVENSGRGIMTESCRAIMEYARIKYQAREFWAGVKKNNVKSIALLERLGFTLYEILPTHLRYHLLIKSS